MAMGTTGYRTIHFLAQTSQLVEKVPFDAIPGVARNLRVAERRKKADSSGNNRPRKDKFGLF